MKIKDGVVVVVWRVITLMDYYLKMKIVTFMIVDKFLQD